MAKIYLFPLSRVLRIMQVEEHEYDPACTCNECTKEHLYRITGAFDEIDDRLDHILDEWEEMYGITPERGQPDGETH